MNFKMILDPLEDDYPDDCVRGDLQVNNNQIPLTGTLADFVGQLILVRFSFWKRSWFLNTDEGIDYVNDVFEKGNDITSIETLFRAVLSSTYGVAAINYFSSTVDEPRREAEFDWEVTLSDGTNLKASDVGPFIITKAV